MDTSVGISRITFCCLKTATRKGGCFLSTCFSPTHFSTNSSARARGALFLRLFQVDENLDRREQALAEQHCRCHQNE
jgi:hypothetical protein